MTTHRLNHSGFTLVEIIAVMIILGVLASLAIPRYINMEQNARERALDAGIAELNGRESLAWSNSKISVSGWIDDATIYEVVKADLNLGLKYEWEEQPTKDGGVLSFDGSQPANLTRSESTYDHPGSWSR